MQEPATLYEMVVAPDGEVLQRVSTAAGIDALEQAEGLLMEAAVVYRREIATGDPAHTIVDIVERFACDLIVIGRTRRQRTAQRFAGFGIQRSAARGACAGDDCEDGRRIVGLRRIHGARTVTRPVM